MGFPTKASILVLCSLLLSSGQTRAAGTLYAMTFDSPGNLYTVNSSTGSVNFVASTSMSQANGIAFDASGQLYSNSNNGNLYRINHQTGATTQLPGGMGISPLEGDLAYNAAADNFLGADSVHSLLYKINKNTGVGSVVGSFGTTGLEISGLTFGPGGLLYGLACNNSNPATLVTIDPVFGWINSTIGLTGTSGSLAGLAYDPTIDTLYMAMGPPGTPSYASLYTVNASTGAATLVGPMGIYSVSGLTVLIPEPASMISMAAAGLFLARSPRKFRAPSNL